MRIYYWLKGLIRKVLYLFRDLMAAKKYELTDETINHNGRTLYRIRALRDLEPLKDGYSIRKVKKGDLGGYVESEKNLSHWGRCWIFNDAKVYANARFRCDAIVYGSAELDRCIFE